MSGATSLNIWVRRLTPREKALRVQKFIMDVDVFMDYFKLSGTKDTLVRNRIAKLLRVLRAGDSCSIWEVCYFIAHNYGYLRPTYQIQFEKMLNELSGLR